MALALDFAQLDRDAGKYPDDLIPEGGTALSLFAAGYLGEYDTVHFVRKQMTIDLVDIDADKLAKMEEIYPNEMTFHARDAWEFAEEAAANGREWDVVSVDPFRGNVGDHVWATLDLWCSLATTLVTVMVDPYRQTVEIEGWNLSLLFRTRNCNWLVLEHA